MENQQWKVGDRIRYNGSSRWQDEEGVHDDTFSIEGRVTKVEGDMATWAREKVLTVHKSNPHVELDALLPEMGGFSTILPHGNRIVKIPEPEPEQPLWIREFGEKWKVPAEILTAVAEGLLEDSSWHNDVCPSFTTGPKTRGIYTLWSDHPRPSRREMMSHRFLVCTNTYAEDMYGKESETFYEGDDVKKALEEIAALAAEEEERLRRERVDLHFLEFVDKLTCVTRTFSTEDQDGVKQCLELYKDYRQGNGYEFVPVGKESEVV